ncbi:hypothetical protein SAMN05443507_10387 [Alicyclobacillus tolerans]|uniref:Uncharacterized protein n=1 Tax=Alicyclobacillus tolerans TaxID=90970 RepID=A0A1M6LUS0_9BACL|nr:hypothetical protein SAMN05443507_10387 [Alicyclobacillus montanus]
MIQGKCDLIAVVKIPDNAVYTRISCTSFYFGVFSENIVCHNIFQALVQYSFGTQDEDIKDKFDQFEDKRNSLLGIFEKLKKAYKECIRSSAVIREYPSGRLQCIFHIKVYFTSTGG